jgi:hypothetical protein
MSFIPTPRVPAPGRSHAVADFWERYSRPVEWIARFRWLLLGPAALICAAHSTPMFGDPIRFARSGAELLQGHLATIYAAPWMQAGPFELIGSFVMLPHPRQHVAAYVWRSEGDLNGLFLVFGAMVVGLLMLTIRFARRYLGLPASPSLELVVGLGGIVSALPTRIWPGGHLAQLAVPFFWVAAGVLATRGRTRGAAGLVGISTGWEPWGVLTAGLLLIDRRPRRLAGAALVLGVAAVLPYLPFVLTGHFAMFGLKWPIGSGTLVHALWPDATWFSWWMRLIQGGSAILAGALIVLALGRRPDVVWLAPLAVVVVRLLLDPLNLSDYWMPLCVLSLVGVGLRKPGDSILTIGCVLLLGYLPPIQLMTTVPWPNRELMLIPISVLLVVLVIRLRRDEPAEPDVSDQSEELALNTVRAG